MSESLTSGFLAELQRRNVIRMAGLYLVGAWLAVQVAETLLPIFDTPDWVLKALVVLLALAFLPTLVFSWLYELTPEGLKRDAEVTPAQSIASTTGRRMDRLIIAGLVAVVALFAADRFFKWEAVLPIMTPVLLIGGMTTGIFTPTEGAIAASVWAVVLGFFWYRTLSWKLFVKISLDTVETTATVLFIVAAASIFGWMLTATGVTSAISEWVLGFTKEPWVFLLLANLLMLFVGCFLEPTAAITILVPILVPICRQLGIDLVHFGLVMVLNLMIGLLHPPMGMVLFVLARVAKLSVERTTMAILPWLFPLLGSLVFITYVPAAVLWLPNLMR